MPCGLGKSVGLHATRLRRDNFSRMCFKKISRTLLLLQLLQPKIYPLSIWLMLCTKSNLFSVYNEHRLTDTLTGTIYSFSHYGKFIDSIKRKGFVVVRINVLLLLFIWARKIVFDVIHYYAVSQLKWTLVKKHLEECIISSCLKK